MKIFRNKDTSTWKSESKDIDPKAKINYDLAKHYILSEVRKL